MTLDSDSTSPFGRPSDLVTSPSRSVTVPGLVRGDQSPYRDG